MNDLHKLILEIIAEIEAKENNLSIAGGRGYSAGKVYPNKTVGVLKMLGKSHEEKEKEYTNKPVKTSKAFKEKKKEYVKRQRKRK